MITHHPLSTWPIAAASGLFRGASLVNAVNLYLFYYVPLSLLLILLSSHDPTYYHPFFNSFIFRYLQHISTMRHRVLKVTTPFYPHTFPYNGSTCIYLGFSRIRTYYPNSCYSWAQERTSKFLRLT